MPAGLALRLLASAALLAASVAASAAAPVSLKAGSTVPPEVTVSDQGGAPVRLRDLLGTQPGRINVVFIFGGGDLGSGQPGHLWCQDSFEDTHILRTLAEKYRGKLGFVAIASAPVYHSGALGTPNRVFLDAADDSAEFRKARDSFVASTQAAMDVGILPFQPHYDFRLRLMLNTSGRTQPGAGYGERESWVGAFRAEGETQFYGVPSFWLIDDDGTVLAEPFRGNVYHPHGGEMRIAYTLADVDAAITRLLGSPASSAATAAPVPAPRD